MQRPRFSQSPNRVGSGPSRPPISTGVAGSATTGCAAMWETAVAPVSVGGVIATFEGLSWRLLGMAS